MCEGVENLLGLYNFICNNYNYSKHGHTHIKTNWIQSLDIWMMKVFLNVNLFLYHIQHDKEVQHVRKTLQSLIMCWEL